MAAAYQQRRVLEEIPPPQPKTAARMKRSYMDVLNSLMGPSSHTSRNSGVSSRPWRNRTLETILRRTTKTQSEDLHTTKVSLCRQQLVQLIQSFILPLKQTEPAVPCSDVKVLLEELHLKKMIVYRSIPYSRLGSNRDAHCYRKAYPHLLAFKHSCQEGGQMLLQNQHWEEALEYALAAWWYTAALPQWEVAGHNALREQCYGKLADLCSTALRHHQPHHSRALELLRRFKMARMHSDLISPCVERLQRIVGEAQDSSTDVTLSALG